MCAQVAVGLYASAPHLPARAELVLALLERTHPDPDDAAQHGLLRALLGGAALYDSPRIVRRVLELDPATASPDGPAPHPVQHAACKGHAEVLEALLSVCPELATLENERGRLLVHEVTGSFSAAAMQVVLRAAPSTATRLARDGMSPLAYAALAGDAGAVAALLHAAPGMAEVAEASNRLPLHMAMFADCAACVDLLLAAAPHTAGAPDAYGLAPVHHAAALRSARAAQALLAHSPHLASSTTAEGRTSVQLVLGDGLGDDAATAAVLRVVLAAAPQLATVECLHLATRRGMVASALELLAVAPGLVQTPDELGMTAIDVALHAAQADAALALAGTRHADPLLLFMQLAVFGAPAEAFVRAIEAHVPLEPKCWRVVPASLPGLLRVLPAVLERGSETDVGEAVAHMQARDREFLKSSIRTLHRAARALPPDLTRHIMGLAC